MLHELLQKIWDSKVTPQDVFLGAALKPAINAFTSRQVGNEKSINTAVNHSKPTLTSQAVAILDSKNKFNFICYLQRSFIYPIDTIKIIKQ